MDTIQMLQRTVYQQPTNGFPRSIGLKSTMRTLKLDHVHQVARWVSVPVDHQQRPPERTNIWENYQLMADLCRPSSTSSNMWTASRADFDAARWVRRCDFCAYHFRDIRQYKQDCQPTTREYDGVEVVVCQCCAILNRPCTLTTLAESIARAIRLVGVRKQLSI